MNSNNQQDSSESKIIEVRNDKKSSSIIIAETGWSPKRWEGYDIEDIKYDYVPHEAWNFFDFGDQFFYVSISKTKPVRLKENGLIILTAENPVTKMREFVGVYGNVQVGNFPLPRDLSTTISDINIRDRFIQKFHNDKFLNLRYVRADKQSSSCFSVPVAFELKDLGYDRKFAMAGFMYVDGDKGISKEKTKWLLLKALEAHQQVLNSSTGSEKEKIESDISIIKKILDIYYQGLEPGSPMSLKYERKQIILYGPPGTGKTYSSVIRAHEIIFGKNDPNITYRSLQDKLKTQQKNEIDIYQLSWLRAIMLAFHEVQKDNVIVDDIKNSKIIQEYSSITNNHTVRNTIWYTLQAESRLDSETVKQKRKTGNEYFDKDSVSNWFLTEKGKEYQKSLVADLQEKPATSSSQFNFITFHQSFSYEDFVEGIRPEISDEENSQISYRIKPGIFKEICKKAELDPAHNYVLIIDEINRGNISKIFGELITLLEDNKRAGQREEITVRLPYSGEDFNVPDNVYIIGTMNSTDKSIALVDVALRRRFHFERLNVNYELIPNADAKQFLKAINSIICALKNPDFEIGHFYFMNIPENDDGNQELKKVFSNRILPLFEEYFFNDWEALATILGPASIQIEPRKKMVWDDDTGKFKKDSGDYDQIYGRCIEPSDIVFENTMKNLGIRQDNSLTQQ